MSIPARFFDGRGARIHRVALSVESREWRIVGDGVDFAVPFAGVRIGERLGSSPTRLSLPDGGSCEVDDVAALDALLAANGVPRSRIERAQLSWRSAWISVAVSLAIAAGGIVWGLPAFADALAQRTPPGIREAISDSALSLFDHGPLQASALPQARQEALAAAFARLAPHCADCRLAFRASPAIGANAFALPDGRIVLLDELVALAEDDEDLLAVIAHEIGHVRHQHGLRLVLQDSALAMLLAAWFGDVSTLLVAVPGALMTSRYSRGFEYEADLEAVAILRDADIDPGRLADMLERLEQAHRRRGAWPAGERATAGEAPTTDAPEPDSDAGAEAESAAASAPQVDYFSTHPATAERVARLRALRDALPH